MQPLIFGNLSKKINLIYLFDHFIDPRKLIEVENNSVSLSLNSYSVGYLPDKVELFQDEI